MSRVHRAATVLLAATALAACAKDSAPPAPRNVVLVVVDTLRADHTGLGGYDRDTTPRLDALAARPGATNFTRAHSTAPWTKPSVASILTGLLPEAHGVTAHPEKLHADFTTLAETFRALGFSTGGVQSNILLASVFGFDQGFDVWNEDHLASHDTSTGAGINAAAFDFLESGRDPEKPFFLYVHHYEPHFRYMRSGERWYPDYPGPLTGDESMDALIGATSQLRDEERDFLVSRYDAEILYQDQLIGELFDKLESLGLGEDTLFVVTADHGEEFLEHGELSHQFKLFEELVHVPLLVVDPRGTAAPLARQGSWPTSLTGLARTLVELTGHTATDLAGDSWLERDATPRESLASTRILGGAPPFALREMLTLERWKLIRTKPQGQPATFQLFDLEADPAESTDLAAERPDLVAELTERLDTELARNRAQGPTGSHTPEPVDLTDDQLQKMRDLGYF